MATKNRFFLITRLGLILEQKVKTVKYSPSNSLSNDIYICNDPMHRLAARDLFRFLKISNNV